MDRRARLSAAVIARRGIGATVIAAVACAAIGPRAVATGDRPGAEPFQYAPPAGFVEAPGAGGGGAVGTQRVWVLADAGSPAGGQAANVSLLHAAKPAPQEEREVAALARGMPQLFASSGSDWTESRHAIHVRPDGARVAVLVGDTRRHDGTGVPGRVIQLAFPDDEGTSIVTASFARDQAAQRDWDREVEATADSARGVAFRASPPPLSAYVIWSVGGGVVTWAALLLAAALGSGRREARSS